MHQKLFYCRYYAIKRERGTGKGEQEDMHYQ